MLLYLRIVCAKKNELGIFVGMIFRETFGLFGVGFTNGIGWILRESYGTLGKSLKVNFKGGKSTHFKV
jgi:hypothetical protein